MRVLFRKIDAAAIVPAYAHPGDAGMDICAIEERLLKPGERALIKTGLQMALPPNAEAQVRPRSGLALKHGITVLNAPGTIDAGYRGEVGVILINLGEADFTVTKGMKIAQMVIAPCEQAQVATVETLDETERGAGGFGSTGL